MPEANGQLSIYGKAALNVFGLASDFKQVRTVIVQPRLNHISERVQTIAEMDAFAIEVAEACAAALQPNAPLITSEEGCRFCKAKATCPKIREEALAQFDDISEPAEATEDQLAVAMSKADLIEGWVKSIRAEVERRLLNGTPVQGYKLVQGKRGNRQWSDKAEAEAVLKRMRLKVEEMYDLSLISPATADKLAKAKVIGPRQWAEVQTLFTQSEGKPSVAPESDKRPAMVTTADVSDFDDVTLS